MGADGSRVSIFFLPIQLHIQLDVSNLALEYVISFLSLFSSSQPSGRNSISPTSASPVRQLAVVALLGARNQNSAANQYSAFITGLKSQQQLNRRVTGNHLLNFSTSTATPDSCTMIWHFYLSEDHRPANMALAAMGAVQADFSIKQSQAAVWG